MLSRAWFSQFLAIVVLTCSCAPVYAQDTTKIKGLPDEVVDRIFPAMAKLMAQGTTGEALQMAAAGKIDAARDCLNKAYTDSKQKGKLDPDIPYFLAAIESHDDKQSRAIKLLQETQSLRQKNGGTYNRNEVLITKRLGDCNYKDRNFKTALNQYNTALFVAQKQNSFPPFLVSEIYESIVACERALKLYDEAEKHAKARVDLTKANLTGGGVNGLLDYSWALMEYSEVLDKTGKKEIRTKVMDDWRNLNIQMIDTRAAVEKSGLLPSFEETVKVFRLLYVKSLAPETPAEVAWAAADFRIKSLPIIAWQPTTDPKAAVICIHGLGLENRAFTATAKALNDKGYLVAALDVRGFGAWIQSKGEEDLDYDRCINDIGALAQVIKERFGSNLPVFLLGESMGGAIALRAGAKLNDKLAGIISSVPSAERYQQRKMNLQTALHFISDPHKAMDVGDYVADRATSQEDVKDAWARDPKAKLALSPLELLKFSNFMRLTKRKCEEIKIPVFMLQGLKDRLVKPQGTVELFEAVASADKSITVMGLAEHLMFENMHPNPLAIEAVDAWLKNHIADPNQTQPPPTTSASFSDAP